jgi:hypothetical protein
VSLDPSNPNIQDRWAVSPKIFWKARGDHLQFTEAGIACVFKKLFGGTARRQAAGAKGGVKFLNRQKSRNKEVTCRRKRKAGSEQNFGCALLRFGELNVLNFDLTPFFLSLAVHYQFNSASRSIDNGY